jgi:hypothetical protein
MKEFLNHIYCKSRPVVQCSGLSPARLASFGLYQDCDQSDPWDYFSGLMPSYDVKINSNILLICPTRFNLEIDELLPYCEISHHGFLPICVDESGDSIAFYVRNGSLYGVSHGQYEGGEISGGWNEDRSGFLPDLEINPANIIKSSTKISSSISDFFKDFE